MSTVLLRDESELEIPNIEDVSEFRQWALSDTFPQRGRIDYILGRIEVDMSPEDFFTHGSLKTQLTSEITDRVNELDLGHTFCADTRVSSASAEISAEPDIVVVTFDAIDAGRVSLVPKSTNESDRFVEIEGGPDLIVEIVSDSSVSKDTQRLPEAYFAAGVREYWLVDARKQKKLSFQIYDRGETQFQAAESADEGFQESIVLRAKYFLDRQRHRRGHWIYKLMSK